MFLATTADERFWKTDEKILFLGEWCRLYSRKQAWSKLDHEVLPHHWKNREKLYLDYQFLDQLYDVYLVKLAAKLNDLHQVDYPIRYWRIIIGPWLFNFIEILFDRYFSLTQAKDSGKVTHTTISDWSVTAWLADDILVFKDWSLKDNFNLYLYAEIIRFINEIPYETLSVSTQKLHDPRPNISSGFFTNSAKKAVQSLVRFLPDSMNRIVFINSYIKPLMLARLQVSLGQLPYPYSPVVKAITHPMNSRMREQLNFSHGSNRFETLLDKMISDLIPTVYVEGYKNMHERALEAFPNDPSLIYTTNALIDNEGFKFWAGWHTTRGSKLVVSQHGGHYGSTQWSAQETHEIQTSDKYFTWGWGEAENSRLCHMPSAQIESRAGHPEPLSDGIILWVGMMVPRYAYWMYSAPVGDQTLEYLEEQKIFWEEALNKVHSLLVYRMPENDFGWDQKKRLTDLIPSLKLYEGNLSFYKQLKQARLCINTCNSTPFLETLAVNFPTLIFWNPEHWELRPSARPFFDELREVGILHDSPKSAATKINEIYQDPMAWWSLPEIQNVREKFCRQFAYTSPTCLSEWKRELEKLTGK